MNTSLRSISQSQTNNKCVRHYQKLFWGWLFFFQDSVYGFAAQVKAILQRTKSNLKRRKLVRFNSLIHLHQTLALIKREDVLNRVKIYISTRKVNARLICGIFLVGCITPLADIFYTFDFLKQFESWRIETKIPGWYYDNYAYLFLSIGPYIAWVTFGFGLYLVFTPANSAKFKKLTLILVILYPVTKIIWLCKCGTHDEFHQFPVPVFFLYGLAVNVSLIIIGKYLIYLLNHKILNQRATMNNITNNRKYLPAEQVVEMYATTWSKMNESY